MKRSLRAHAISPTLQFLATIALAVFILHAARPVLIPIACSVMLVFVLTPLVRLLTRAGLGRSPSIAVTLTLFLALLGGAAWLAANQAASLARELPQHKERIRAKIDDLRKSSGPFGELMSMVDDLMDPRGAAAVPAGTTLTPAIWKAMEAAMPSAAAALRIPETKPPVVVARMEEHPGIAALAGGIAPILEPLASAALVAVLVIFMLFNREDMRNRFIGLLGGGKLTGTTRMLSDATDRVSRYLLFQLLINISFGILLAVGLAILGVHYYVLWGFLSAALRFIPYVGTWISAFFPVVLSFATADGWRQPIEVFTFFLVLDILTGQVVEPILLGRHTGISPVALLVAATFWAWLWGPIGLLLSTPITACMAVIGQHIPRLRPLAVLLDDRPAMQPYASLYQRLLASDDVEAKTLLADAVKERGEGAAFDQLVAPALVQLRMDRETNELSEEEEMAILDQFEEMAAPEAQKPLSADAPSRGVVLGIPAHHRVEETLLRMVGRLLPHDKIAFETVSSNLLLSEIEEMVAKKDADAVVVGLVEPGGKPHSSYICRRLAKRFPDLRIIVAHIGSTDDLAESSVSLRRVGATAVLDSLAKVAEHVSDAVDRAAEGRLERARLFPAA